MSGKTLTEQFDVLGLNYDEQIDLAHGDGVQGVYEASLSDQDDVFIVVEDDEVGGELTEFMKKLRTKKNVIGARKSAIHRRKGSTKSMTQRLKKRLKQSKTYQRLVKAKKAIMARMPKGGKRKIRRLGGGLAKMIQKMGSKLRGAVRGKKNVRKGAIAAGFDPAGSLAEDFASIAGDGEHLTEDVLDRMESLAVGAENVLRIANRMVESDRLEDAEALVQLAESMLDTTAELHEGTIEADEALDERAKPMFQMVIRALEEYGGDEFWEDYAVNGPFGGLTE